jgi:hypothetical protein
MTAPPRRTRTAPTGTVVAYIRVSTDEQVASGAGLEAQRAAIAAEAARRGPRADHSGQIRGSARIRPVDVSRVSAGVARGYAAPVGPASVRLRR